jgi:hypothetical protein
MMTWMNKSRRKPARAAQAAVTPVKAPPPPPVIDEDELPPPFFADSDPAFLDLGDDVPLEAAKPVAPSAVEARPTVVAGESVETRLARLVLDLPAFPRRDGKDRTRELLAIYRQLDRIAADAISEAD